MPFFNRNFFLLWQGQLVSHLGSQAFLIAVMYWVMEATGSASLMGLIMMLSALPMVLLSPVGGTVADWYGRRTILIVSDVLSGVGILSLAAVLFWLPEQTDTFLVWLCVVVALTGAIHAFFQPAITAAIPDLVAEEQVAGANALMQFSGQASTLVGQGIGGVLFQLLGAPVLFLIDGISYLFSAVSEAFIRLPKTARPREAGARAAFAAFWQDTVAGIRYVWQRVGMRNLLLAASLINFFMMPVFVLLPFYVELQLAVGAGWYGFLLAAISGGSILGYVLAGAWTPGESGRRTALLAAFLATTVLVGVLGLVTTPWVALGVVLAVGLASGFINIHVLTLFQTQTPAAMRGRVLSLVITLASAVTPLGMLLGGVVGDLTDKNLPLIYGVSGLGATLVILLITANRDFRAFLAQPAPAAAEG